VCVMNNCHIVLLSMAILNILHGLNLLTFPTFIIFISTETTPPYLSFFHGRIVLNWSPCITCKLAKSVYENKV